MITETVDKSKELNFQGNFLKRKCKILHIIKDQISGIVDSYDLHITYMCISHYHRNQDMQQRNQSKYLLKITNLGLGVNHMLNISNHYSAFPLNIIIQKFDQDIKR